MTDYPHSLALWAGTTDEARLSDDETERAAYWDSFREAIRKAELQLQKQLDAEVAANADAVSAVGASACVAAGGSSSSSTTSTSILAPRPLGECRSQARYGSGPDTVRMGREYTAAELMPIVPEVFDAGRVALGAGEL